ncbi:hypothetical protein P3G55_06835 [Leptospira sp. 96542]|nr:hypothetical protein [Leptospira sp. 96542]
MAYREYEFITDQCSFQGKAWTNAENLSNGDVSPTWSGIQKSKGIVEKGIAFTEQDDTISGNLRGLAAKMSLAVVGIEVLEEETTVYNFEVEEDHTYFVTEAEVWVHNNPYCLRGAISYGNVLQLQTCKDQACKEKVAEQITKASEAELKILAVEAGLLGSVMACTYACPPLIATGQGGINRISSLFQNIGRSNPNAVQQEIKTGQEAAKGITNTVPRSESVLGHIFRNASGHVNPFTVFVSRKVYKFN